MTSALNAPRPGDQRRIVVGVDGSDASVAALEWAVVEARRRGAPVAVIHAWFPAGMPLVAEQVFAEADARAIVERTLEGCDLSGVTVTRQTPVRSAGSALLDAASTAALVVVGRHGAGLHPYIGGVAQQVLHHSATPVAVIAREGVRGTGIVVGVDGSASSMRALQWALAEGELRNTDVTAVLAWTLLDQLPCPGAPDFDPRYSADSAVEALRAFVHSCRDTRAQNVGLRAVNDLPARALLDGAADAELLVSGARGVGGFRGLLLGSVSRRLVAEAPCPVVCVPC